MRIRDFAQNWALETGAPVTVRAMQAGLPDDVDPWVSPEMVAYADGSFVCKEGHYVLAETLVRLMYVGLYPLTVTLRCGDRPLRCLTWRLPDDPAPFEIGGPPEETEPANLVAQVEELYSAYLTTPNVDTDRVLQRSLELFLQLAQATEETRHLLRRNEARFLDLKSAVLAKDPGLEVHFDEFHWEGL